MGSSRGRSQNPCQIRKNPRQRSGDENRRCAQGREKTAKLRDPPPGVPLCLHVSVSKFIFLTPTL